MAEPLPTRPAPIPAPDRHQIERLNALYAAVGEFPVPTGVVRRAVASRLWGFFGRLFLRQQEFNAAVVDHLNRNAAVGLEAHLANAQNIEWTERLVTEALERLDIASQDMARQREALLARERRGEAALAAIAATQQELRAAVNVVQQATQNLKRELMRMAAEGVSVAAAAPGPRPATPAAPSAPANQLDTLDSHKYVGFEDQFRGSPEDIQRRVSEYLPVFAGARDVLDVGCGRGEFLALLREHGVSARGIDVNGAMVEVCRSHGLDAAEADALAYLRSQPDGSLGGLFAAQVIEHLEPRYLTQLLDAAFDKLRPGAPIVLETINPACWFAFFESYIRDLTHVRPVHPDTLRYLLVASGFERVDIRYRAPYPEAEKLQPVGGAADGSLADWAETINANVEKINGLLFTWLDYAAIGHRP